MCVCVGGDAGAYPPTYVWSLNLFLFCDFRYYSIFNIKYKN